MRTTNNTSLKRTARLLLYENKSSCYIYKIIIGGFVLLAFVMLMRVLNHAADHDSRLLGPIFRSISNDMLTTIIALSPIIFYYKLFKKKYAAMYATLPVSNTERYLSLLANTFVVAPITIIAVKMCIDFIAAGFSMKHFVFHAQWDILDLVYQDKAYFVINYLITIWGLISMNTLFLLLLTQQRIWKAVAIIILTLIAELNLTGEILDILSGDDGLAPSKLVTAIRTVSLINIVVFQIITYYMLKRIKA